MTSSSNPFNELPQLLERMQQNFEKMARSYEDEPFEMVPTPSEVRVDFKDEDEELVLTAELPGFDEDDLNVRVTDHTLHIAAEHEEESEEKTEGEYLRQERRHASVTRSIRLPEGIKKDEIEATYNNGILTVRMPKSEPMTEGTKVEIN